MKTAPFFKYIVTHCITTCDRNKVLIRLKKHFYYKKLIGTWKKQRNDTSVAAISDKGVTLLRSLEGKTEKVIR